VRLDPHQRQIAGQAIVQMFHMRDIEVIAVSVDAIHFHLLARFPDRRVRWHVGEVKRHAYFALKQVSPVRKVWARRCDVTPVSDRSHQVNVFNYICRHGRKGAWVWTFREGLYWR